MSASGSSGKRKSYTVEYKKAIVEESWGKNLVEFCKNKMLDHRLVQKWRAEYTNLSEKVESGMAKKRKIGCGRQPMYTELESLVCEWVADRRAKTLVVTRAQIQEYALAVAPQFDISPEQFKASQHWVDNFLERNDLSLRRATTLFRLEDAEVVKRAFAYKKFVDDIDFSKYSLCNMIAMDETAVFMGQAAQTTIDQRGASSVYVPSTAYESARVTCILAIRLDGTKVTPLLIAKGKKEKIERFSGIYVLETEKAWATQAAIRKWLDVMLPLVMRGNKRGMLIWDAASTHRAKTMKSFLHERRIDQIMIPAGMTAYLQTLDIAINKPFKDHLRAEINDYIENRMERNVRGNFVKPRLPEIVNWVKNSWDKITDTCIANALRAGYLDKTCSFQDSAIATHERYGPIIQQKIESQENPQEPQSVDIYDDVPEDDDMVPSSGCSEGCSIGFRKAAVQGKPPCCYACVPCLQREISNQTDSLSCFRCPWDQWPNPEKSKCLLKPIQFLSYEDILGASLCATSIMSSIVPAFILGLFFHHHTTPLVKASNYSLSCLLLMSLSLCFFCSLGFIGYPDHDKCLLRQVSFGLVFTLCVSCILAKTIMVVFAFMATRPGSRLRKWTTPRVSYSIISICFLLQLLLCITWMSVAPPFPQYNTEDRPELIIADCNNGSPIAFWAMLGYLFLLATISFIVAFLARKLPDSFNEAQYITFSMLAFLCVWISFIPAYLSAQGKYTVTMELFAILVSSWALLICMFFPKCFILLFRPEMNSREHLMLRNNKGKEITNRL
ncbi:uncharacterized protein [Dendropsophus ebraccatus]|uniref:uncharacterized protein n=1 Tax=Dendropsophus ebraccatus TaxID=150705 RepID=UPI0038311D2D